MQRQKLARALVAHAAAYLPGDEDLNLPEIRDTILTLAEDPLGKSVLDQELAKLNDPETRQLVVSLIQRVIADLERDCRTNATKVSVVIQPWQAGSITGVAGTVMGVAAGTLTLPWAIPMGVVFLAAAAVSSVKRNRTAGVESELRRKADLAKALL